jgi:hypothetical protein
MSDGATVTAEPPSWAAGRPPLGMTEDEARRFVERQRIAAATALERRIPLTDPDVATELFENPFYYLQTCLWVEDKMTQRLVPFIPKPVQVMVLSEILVPWYMGEPVRLIILKARREGVSTIVQAFLFWLCATRRRRKAFTIAQDDDTSKYLHSMSETYYSNMPAPMRPMRGVSQAGRVMQFANPTKNVEERSKSPGLDSSMRTVSLKNAGAGQGSTLLHLSEVGLWPDDAGRTALQTVLKIVPDGPETLVVRESTARGIANAFHTMWQRAVSGVSDYKPIFIPWHWEPTNRTKPPRDFMRTPEEQELSDEHQLTDDQLFWRRQAIENLCDGDPDNFKQEFPITADEAFLSTGRPFFPPMSVKRGLEKAKIQPPVYQGHLEEQAERDGDTNSGRGWTIFVPVTRRPTVRIWETNDPLDDYLISGDASGGNPLGDFHAAYVYRRSTMRIVAAWHGKVEREDYGDALYRLGKLYPGVTTPLKAGAGALIAVEITGGWGQVPVSVLKWRKYPRIYARPIAEDEISRDQSDRLGWDSTIKTRPLALDALKKAIRQEELECYDERLYDECSTFAYAETGKPEAMDGCWDDRVMAAAIGCYLWATHPRRHAPKKQIRKQRYSHITG